MVATVLKLRYRVLANNLLRRPWQLVGFCFGVLWALGALALVVIGTLVLGTTQPLDLIAPVIVLGGSLLLVGWLLGPLLVAGLDPTVDAVRLAPFPLRKGQVMAALAASGLAGIPGIVTVLAALATLLLWMRWPGALVVALPGVILGVLSCVVATQLMSALSSAGGGSRRGREIIGTVVLVVLILAGPITTGIISLLSRAATDLATQFSTAASILGWSPIGAAWAAPVAAAGGAWGEGAAKLLIAAATLAGLLWAWARALEGGTTSSAKTARVVRPGSLGLFGRMPTGGVGATWARSLTAWLRDPRYLRQLLVVPLFPVLFAFTGGTDSWFFGASAVLAALILSIAGYADISYDGTAFASVLATGVRGRHDRLGRLLGAASVGVPLLLVVAVVTTALTDGWARFPAILGGALGLLLAGYAVTAVSSALIVVPVAAPGDSPFRSVPGQTFLNGLLVFVVWGACLVLATPALILTGVATATASAPLGWTALAVGIVGGVGVIVAGVVVGGRTLDRNGPALLARIRVFPT